MLILSSSPSFLGSRVSCTPSSTPPLSSPSSSYSASVRFDIGRSRTTCLCFCSSSSRAQGMAEVLRGTNRESNHSNKDNIVASSLVDDGESRCTTFLRARSGQELLSGIKKKKEAGRLPPDIASRMEELYNNYRNAVVNSGVPEADEIVLSNMSLALDRIFTDVEEPFDFASYHKAKRNPFDYYMFVQNYIRPLIDFRNSYVGNMAIFHEMEQQLQQGHNIILISNHQTEADPAVIALLLENSLPRLAEDLTYIAGDRVVTDPLCKPFSMGRNLVCVYSKKHMNDEPELVEMKRRANTKSLKEMAVRLREGSQILWIAPSGGRDRPDPKTGEWYPGQTPFDSSSVDNMRRLVEHAVVPGHIYPLTLLCYDIMPPPPKVEKEIGERRMISFHGTGLSAGQEISFQSIADVCQDPQEAKEAYTQALYDSVTEQYTVLRSAVHGKQGLKASIPTVCLSQPWS